jgi:PIN domain nuclease of toxin-antitoxin system
MSWLVRHGRIASLALTLPEHHKDLQDRLIIATAIIYYARLLSFDAAFPADQELNGRLINR